MDENILALLNGGGGNEEMPPIQETLMGKEKNILVHMSREEVQNFSRAQGGLDENPELKIPQFTRLGEMMGNPEVRNALKVAIKSYLEASTDAKHRLEGEMDSYADERLGDEKSIQIPSEGSDPTAEALAQAGTRDDTELVLMPEKLVFFLWDQLPPDYHEINPTTGFPQFGLGSFLGTLASGVASFFTGGAASVIGPILSGGLMAYGAYDDYQNQKTHGQQVDDNYRMDKENFERDQHKFRTLKGMDVPLWRGEEPPKTPDVNLSFRRPFKKGGAVEPIRTLKSKAPDGLIRGDEPGQADNIHVDVPKGARIIDAATVSYLGDGNSEAGAKKLHAFISKLPSIHDEEDLIMVPCALSAGEVEVYPDKVRGLGKGSLAQGHKLWDNIVKEVRIHKQHSHNTIPKAAMPIEHYLSKRARSS